MPQSWVRKRVCKIDRAGGQCIGDDEALTHHTKKRGEFDNAPRTWMEDEVSLQRGRLTVAAACAKRNGGWPAHPADVAAAAVRYTTAGKLREAGFAVVHTPGIAGEENGHISVVWPDTNPLDEQTAVWPPDVQEAFAACFTEGEG